MLETRVQSLGREEPLEKEMVTHSSVLAWEIPWMEEPGTLYSPWGRQRVSRSLAAKQQMFVVYFGKNKDLTVFPS